LANTQQDHDQNIHPHLQGPEPGPSTHPLGPPQSQWVNQNMQQDSSNPQDQDSDGQGGHDSNDPLDGSIGSMVGTMNSTMNGTQRRYRAGRGNVPIGSEEWQKRKKESHKEVERRRRGNINEGIDALAAIVPNGTGEKAKGAILSRSVQYIHHLKENEARNIEKWTLEKLLMDQAMGDLQNQVDEMKKIMDKEIESSLKKDEQIAKLKKEIASLKARLGNKKEKNSEGGEVSGVGGMGKRASEGAEDDNDGPVSKRQKVLS